MPRLSKPRLSKPAIQPSSHSQKGGHFGVLLFAARCAGIFINFDLVAEPAPAHPGLSMRTRTGLPIRIATLCVGALVASAALALAASGAASATQVVHKTKPVPPSPPAEAVGLYPTTVSFNDAFRGGEYISTIGMLNGTANGEWFHFSLNGKAAPWLSVVPSQGKRPIKEIWAPNGSVPTRAILQLKLPPTVADGVYRGVVTVWMKPPETKKNGPSTVGLGGQINVAIAVKGTEVVNGKLINAYAYPKLEQGTPLRLFTVVDDSGNVSALPSFHLQVFKQGAARPVYNWVGTTGEPLLPGQRSTFELDWPAKLTRGATLGAYRAKIASVTFPGNKDVGKWSLAFQLYPYGFLHRGGRLFGLELMEKPKVGSAVEVQASVASTGELQQQTYFVGQLYRNGEFLQEVTSPVPILLAPAGQQGAVGIIRVPLEIRQAGRYRLTGVANFGGAQSASKSVVFTAGGAGLSTAYLIAIGVAGLIGVIALLVAAGMWHRRRRPPTAPPLLPQPPPRYTATRPRTVQVPPRSPVGAGRPQQRSQN